MIGYNLLGECVEQQVEIHYITLEYQVLDADVIIFCQKVYGAESCSASLSRHIRQTVARARTYTNSVGKAYSSIHQVVQHAAGEDTAHTAALENKSRPLVQYIFRSIHHHSFACQR